MSLRRQLLLASLLLLALPWAGYQYFAQMVEVVLQGELEVRRARAEAILAYLQSRPELFRDLLQVEATPRLFFLEEDEIPLVDGLLEASAETGEEELAPRLVRVRDSLYIGLEIPGAEGSATDIRLLTTAASLDLRLLSDQSVLAFAAGADSQPLPGLLGRWHQLPGLLSLEVAFPASLAGANLGIDLTYGDNLNRRWGISPQGVPSAWVSSRPDLARELEIFRQVGNRLALVTTDGWTVASVGDPGDQSRPASLWSNIVSRLLPTDAGILTSGGVESRWIRGANSPQLRLILPLQVGGLTLAYLQSDSDFGDFLGFHGEVLRRWALLSLGLLALVSLGFFAYASWLSWRIRQLSRWTRGLIDDRGRIDGRYAPSVARDEIGELSRDYAELTRRLQQYTSYVQGLAARLSHEIRTPLTIIGSSLDNLDNTESADERKAFADRARQGVERLRRMLRRMAEASTLEAGIDRTPRQNFDPDALIAELARGYGQTYSHLIYRRLDPSLRVRLDGSPDLLAQLVDKLVENALSFAASGTQVLLCSGGTEGSWRLQVINEGPPLPTDAEADIFAAMVSLRPADSASGHLGLGLGIVRRIAEFHRGQVSAHNLPQGRGVVFEVEIPCAPA